MAVDPVRAGAISILLRVLNEGKHTDVLLDRKLSRGRFSPQGGRFLTHLVYGVVRHKLLCDHVLSGICEQPLDQLPPPVLMVLRMGVYQQFFCDNVTRPAMVHTSVDLAKHHSHPGLARLVNAVLRRVPDTLDAVSLPDRHEHFMEYLRVRYSMPRRLVRRWIHLYGQEGAERFCAACNIPAPMTLRVNTLLTDSATLAGNLKKAGIAVSRPCEALEALQVEGTGNPLKTPWFKRGHFMVQDLASMLPAHLAAPKQGTRALDLCAAPGGKTTHLAALSNNEACIVAQDRYWGRLARIRENCARLGVSGVHTVCADGLEPPFREAVFDVVLVDAPCSGLGTLRRHPEIKWRTEEALPARLAEGQRAMLRKAVEVCKNGGLIVYSVCTLTPEETTDVVSDIAGGGVCLLEDGPESFDTWKIAQGQYQTNPADAAWDGFFLTRFRKRS